MTINEFLEKWGRTFFEAPLAATLAGKAREEPPELAEIRLAVLDQVRQKSYRSGGRKVFPFDLVRVDMRGLEEDRYAMFAGRFFRKYLEQEIHNALRDAGCRFPENLRVEVQATPGLPQRGENWVVVEVGSQTGTSKSVAKLVVREGTANAPEVRLDKARINIGRVVDVYRAAGLFRRNDLAFAAETEINRSVSREHAHILFDRVTGEYRLFNDRWYPRGEVNLAECGTWIVRDGFSHEVHRNARGTKLEHGDEIHFGHAVVVFQAD